MEVVEERHGMDTVSTFLTLILQYNASADETTDENSHDA
jgi:hypothetical protein